MKHLKGFTVVELLLAMALSAVAVGMSVTITTTFYYQFNSNIIANRLEKAANRFGAEFVAGMKGASSFAIYADRNTWAATPSNMATSGNFLFITTSSGASIAFELTGGNLNLINDPAGSNEALTCNSNATASNGSLVSVLNGVPTVAWTVNTPAELLNFQFCAQPIRRQ